MACEQPEQDEVDFPSGEWIGYYQQGSARYRQDLTLSFRDGNLSGDGIDSTGAFTIRGRYDTETREARWTKSYLGGHDVTYRGFREIKGIWGTWELIGQRGGFHIWPRAEGEAIVEATAAAEEVPTATRD